MGHGVRHGACGKQATMHLGYESQVTAQRFLTTASRGVENRCPTTSHCCHGLPPSNLPQFYMLRVTSGLRIRGYRVPILLFVVRPASSPCCRSLSLDWFLVQYIRTELRTVRALGVRLGFTLHVLAVHLLSELFLSFSNLSSPRRCHDPCVLSKRPRNPPQPS